jgi:xanthosine utilization system XapX-like protein
MAKYDSGILQDYADSLYRKAAWVTFKCGLVGTVVGVLVALVLAYIRDTRILSDTPWPVIAVFGIVGLLIGVAIGQRRSFAYRLQAQTVLCQMQIEYNTRPTK